MAQIGINLDTSCSVNNRVYFSLFVIFVNYLDVWSVVIMGLGNNI